MSKPLRRVAALLIAATAWLGAMGVAQATSGPDASCVKGVEAMTKAGAATSSASAGNSAGLDAAVKTLKSYAAKSPKEIRSDMKRLATAYGKAAKLLKDLKYDPASGKMPSVAMMAKLAQASKALDSKSLNAASARVEKWFSTHCATK